MKTAFFTWAAVWPLSMGAGGFVREVLADWPAWLQGGATSALIVVGLNWVVRPLARRALKLRQEALRASEVLLEVARP